MKTPPAFVVAFVGLMAIGASGCGTGAIIFEARNGGPTGVAGAPAKPFDVDCVDGFDANGQRTALGSAAGLYSVGCSYDGKAMAWKILGIFHAAPIAHHKWDQYRAEVAEKATARGCPGVAVRRHPPSQNQEGEAIGAFCIAL